MITPHRQRNLDLDSIICTSSDYPFKFEKPSQNPQALIKYNELTLKCNSISPLKVYKLGVCRTRTRRVDPHIGIMVKPPETHLNCL
jgi:hypothetical protein